MFVRGTLRLGRIAGIEIAVHPSWLLIYALFAWSAITVAPSLDPHLSKTGVIVLGLVYALALFFSVVLHELSHAIVARRLDIPVGNITLFLFGGVASILREPGTPDAEVKMAAAGPGASVVISIVCSGIGAALPYGWWKDLFLALAWSNAALAVFNLLPAFPSDGGRILRAIIWHFRHSQARATQIAGVVSLVVAALLIAGGIFFTIDGEKVFETGPTIIVRGWWWILIGLFLGQAALASMRGARVSLILESMPVSECMARTLIPVPTTTTIAGFIAQMAVAGRSAGYPVVDDGAFVGLVTLQDTAAVPHVLWPQTPITAVMTPSSRTPAISAQMPAFEALETLDSRHLGELPVFENGTLTGVVSKETIFAALHARGKALS
ncbi:MAG TPA: site-2 protease family protein [Candidatus Eremiobacteraceae bacterium]|nr:site-2 protease family protein [Candidatus Eremiobacteraceae bacterium]